VARTATISCSPDTIGRRSGRKPSLARSRGRASGPACRAFRFHDLRHSAATALLAEGVPLVVISEWLGHSGVAITASAYAAIVPNLQIEARDAMDRALGGES